VWETGPADGPVVVLCNAAPGSRAFDPDPEATTAAGVRLIAVDRAGYGASSPLPEDELPTVAGYAADVAVVLDELGVTTAAVAGWSAGGRVAAALAAARPELVTALALIATPAPHEAVAWIPDEQLAMIESMRDDALSATTQLTPAFAEMAGDPAGAVGSVSGGEADDAALAAEPWRRERLEAMLAEAFAQGGIGLAADIVSYTLVPWGEDLASVSCPTTAWYGAGDPVVTPAHGEWYLSQVGAAGDLTVVPDIGHLVVMTRWADILAALA
jgi:pimeloyl-ACP methyl ester carboxylesterase